MLVAERRVLDRVEDFVGHQVGLVRLAGRRRPQLGCRLLVVDGGQCRHGADSFRANFFHPVEPAADKRLVDAGNRRQAAGRVAIHGGIADGSLGTVAGG